MRVLLTTILLAGPLLAVDQTPPEQELITRYLAARQVQAQALKGAQMEVDIDGNLPKLEKRGRLRALRSISRLGQIIYKPLGFTGDNTVKQELIARYLSAEVEDRDRSSMAITPANYKFKLKNTMVRDGRDVAIFELNPKSKKVGLFKGELWVDTETGMPLREQGRWVKNPSVFLKKVEFVNIYELKDGVALPKHLNSKMDVRLFGKAELDIMFSNYSHNPDEVTAAQ